MSEEQRWASSAGESFAVALEHLRSRIIPLREKITELAVALNNRQEELLPLEQVEAELEKWCLEASADVTASTTTSNPADSHAPQGPVTERPSGQPTRCDLIIALMSQDPQRQWRPRDVACGLGVDNVNTVRSLMQYMAGKGRLRKNPDASYQLPEATLNGADAREDVLSALIGDPGNDDRQNVTHASFGRGRSRRPRPAVDRDQVLSFLRKNAGRRWRPGEISAHLEIGDADAVREALQELTGRGLVVKHNHGRFQYVPPGTSAGRAV
jgi:hypothetical protein